MVLPVMVSSSTATISPTSFKLKKFTTPIPFNPIYFISLPLMRMLVMNPTKSSLSRLNASSPRVFLFIPYFDLIMGFNLSPMSSGV